MIKRKNTLPSQRINEEEKIKKLVLEKSKKKNIRTCEDIIQDIQEVKESALNEGDYRTALKAIELEGKQLAMCAQLYENKDKNIEELEKASEEMSVTIKDFLLSLEKEE